MKVNLISFVFLLLTSACQADCLFNGERFPAGPVSVDLSSLFNGNSDEVLSGSIYCDISPGYSTGSVTSSSVKIGPALTAAKAGVTATLNGVSANSDGDFHMALHLKTKYVLLVKIHLSQDAGHAIIIHEGDELFQFSMSFSESGNSGIFSDTQTYKAVAANDGNINTGICHINNDNPINVDFGNLGIKKLGEGIGDENDLNSKTVPILYSCDNADVTQKIKVRLVAINANYSLPEGNIIRTSTEDVGVALIHNGGNIQPGSYFESEINKGQGYDAIKILMIKNPNVDINSIKTGAFNASAILIIDED